MKKFAFLLGNFLKKRIVSKAFIFTNIIFIAIAFVIVFLPTFISSRNDKRIVYEKFNISIILDYDIEDSKKDSIKKFAKKTFEEKFPKITINSPYKENTDKIDTKDKRKKYCEEKNINVGIFLQKKDEKSSHGIIYINKEYSSLETLSKNFTKNIDRVINGYNENTVEIETQINFKDATLKEGIISAFATLLVSLEIILLVQAVQASSMDVVVEKTNKVIEQIILNVSAKVHFLSKVIGGVLFSIIQILLLISYLFLAGFFANKGVIDALPAIVTNQELFSPILFGVLFTIAGAFLLILIFIYLAAMSNSQEDFATISSPLFIVFTLFLYVPLFLINYKEASITKISLEVLAYIPPFSIISAPLLLTTTIFTWWKALISLTILLGFSSLLLYLLLPTYKIAILNYNIKLRLFKRISYYMKTTKNKKKEKK